jgi:hypothetical protein
MLCLSHDRVTKFFYVEGDSYCNVYLRNKTYLNTTEPEQIGCHWSQRSAEGDRKYHHNKYNAWCYAVVFESTVEPRLIEEFLLGKAILI